VFYSNFEGHLACKKTGCWFVVGDDLTRALQFARLIAPVVQLSPPPPPSFASINTGQPRFTWKMAVKMERVTMGYLAPFLR